MPRLNVLLVSLFVALIAAPPVLAQEGGREPLPWLWWFAPIGSIIALAFAWIFYQSVMKLSEGTPEMVEIAQAVREGAMAYLRRQYKVVGIVFVVLFLIFAI